ncbi:MAG: hypothetical protein M1816_000128 [Peltula sp. TS41687]|nr:MAG: hypothetical protein M1816_000128 [Peltula sp. TS41687]
MAHLLTTTPVYFREQDLPALNKSIGKLNRYADSIQCATLRAQKSLDELSRLNPESDIGRLLYRALLFESNLFLEILSELENAGCFVGAHQDEVRKLQDNLTAFKVDVGGDETDQLNMVPAMSSWELTVHMVAEYVGENNPNDGEEELISQTIQHVKGVYGNGETSPYSGLPAMIALCASVNHRILVASSKCVWPAGSFLQLWALQSRRSLFRGRLEEVREIIQAVDERVERAQNEGDGALSQKEVLLELASESTPLTKMAGHRAQAFEGTNLLPRDRCWRCRVTFGYDWLSQEKNPTQTDVGEVRDFEQSPAKRDPYPGKCAEYLLWICCTDEEADMNNNLDWK